MHKFLSWLVTPPFLVAFAMVMVFFQPLHMIAIRFGLRAHNVTLIWLNWGVITVLRIAGTKFIFENRPDLSGDVPRIVVSNHQSMFDIPLLVVLFGERQPKFVAKRELSRWVPSVSYNLRHGGSAIIDRSDSKNALKIIQEFGKSVFSNRWTACIFPEGTRARDGRIKPFKTAGACTLIKSVPGALVYPVAIDGSWKLSRYKLLPIPFGTTIRVKVLPPISAGSTDARTLLADMAAKIGQQLEEFRATP